METLGFDDVNADGLLEWTISFQWRIHGNTDRELYILGWQDGALVDLFDDTLAPRQVSTGTAINWIFANVDDDPAQELEQQSPIQDNWGCHFTRSSILDWDGSAYVSGEPLERFPETPECNLRRAESAMWAGHYLEAVTFYESVPALSAYARIRLAMAYILADQEAQGQELLSSLQASGELPDLVNVLSAAYAANSTPAGLCMAAYEFFYQQPFYVYERTGLEVGRHIDGLVLDGAGGYMPVAPRPARAGCDAPALIEQLVASHAFPVDEAPGARLTNDLGIATSETLSADLDGDGLDEWLIWPALSHINPIFFAPEGDIYHTSHPAIFSPSYAHPPARFSSVTPWQLPGDTGMALVSLDFDRDPFLSATGYTGGPGPLVCQNQWDRTLPYDVPGTIQVWRLAHGELEVIFSENQMCEVDTVEDIFPGGQGSRELHGWHRYPELQAAAIPTVFTWDDSLATFVLPPPLLESTPTPRPTPPPDPALIPDVYDFMWEAEAALRRHEYLSVLDNVAAALEAGERQENQAVLLQVRYLGALALEALDRPEEALAEYGAIYEAAPESMWGMVAALHLEPVE